MGLDDTSFTPGCLPQTIATLPPFVYSTTQSPSCSATFSPCLQNTSQCIPADQFCNFKPECTDQTDESSCPSTCSFEQQDLCQWRNDQRQKLTWELGTGRTTPTGTGPSTGKYFH